MANCNRQQLNITCGTDVVLHDRLIFDGETFDPNLSVGIAANLVSSLGKRTALDVEVVDDELLISVPWVDGTLPGCYGLEVTGSCNSKKWATYADSLIRYTKATVPGESEVTIESDTYDITQEVGYCYFNSPVTFANVTVDDGYGTPGVDVTYEQRVLSMAFHNLKGNGITDIDVDEQVGDEAVNTVTIKTDADQEGTEFKVRNGRRGNGIASSSEQLSDQDGGVNTFTITDDDGTVHEFHSKNGTKGSQGDSAVYDPSSPDAPDFVMANTTGQSTTKSMTQKAITDELMRVETWSETQITPSGGKNSIINTSGNWQTGASAYRNCYITPVLPNRTYRIVKGAYPFQIMLLTDNTVTAGSPAPFATGESYRDFVSDSEILVTTPSDAAYMYIRHLDGSSSSNAYDRTPSYIALMEFVKEHISGIDGAFGTIEEKLDDINGTTEFSYTNRTRYNGYQVGATVTVSTNIANIAGAKVPCSPGDTFVINGTGYDASRLIAFTDENNVIISVCSANITLENFTIHAPEGASFLYSNVDTRTTYSNIVRYNGKLERRLMSVEAITASISDKVSNIFTKEEIAFQSPKRYGGATLGNSISNESSTVGYAARKIACQPGDTFLLTSTGADNFRLFYWLDEEEICIDRSLPNISVNDFLLVTPPNAAWLIVNCYPSSDPHTLYKIGGLAKDIEENKPTRDTVKVLYGNSLHKEKISSIRFSAPSVTESRGNALTLLHFSDLHDNFNAARRMAEYCKLYAPYIDDVINTGDTMHTHYSGEYVFAAVWAHYNDFGKNILTVIGNHDSRANDDSSWYTNAGINCYNKFIAPSVENWGVTQPEDADTSGKCYYYKDYTEKGIRLIVLDNMVMAGENYDESQITWFQDVLADALANNLAVVGAKHYSAHVIPFEGAWHERNATDMSACDIFYDAVDTFIGNGGKFICWISGHTHYNVLGTVDSHPNQLSIAVGSCVVDNYQYSTREGAAQDCFNLVSFDTTQKRIKVLRVGNTIDWKLQHHEMLCVDYNTRTIISSI